MVPAVGADVFGRAEQGRGAGSECFRAVATGAHGCQSKERQRETVATNSEPRRSFEHNCDDPESMEVIGTNFTRHAGGDKQNDCTGGPGVPWDRVRCGSTTISPDSLADASRSCGLCSRESIFAKPSLTLHPEGGTHPNAASGVLDGNPVHEDMLEAAMMTPPDFCVNVTLPESAVRIFRRTFDAAHREACSGLSGHYEVECEPAPLVIAGGGGAPKDSVFIRRTNLSTMHSARSNRTARSYSRRAAATVRSAPNSPTGLPSSRLEEIESRLREKYVVLRTDRHAHSFQGPASNTYLFRTPEEGCHQDGMHTGPLDGGGS